MCSIIVAKEELVNGFIMFVGATAAGSWVCTFAGGLNISVLVPTEAVRHLVGAPYASGWFDSESGWAPTMST